MSESGLGSDIRRANHSTPTLKQLSCQSHTKVVDGRALVDKFIKSAALAMC
jgi:hypothetical protein